MNRLTLTSLSFITALCAWADSVAESDTTTQLREVSVAAPRGVRKLKGATNSELISASELKRAACCNLGESFTTNPSVDVNYSDAATGARQIKLLGLSGQYVQMMTENIPNFRGAAAPYGLGYVAGPWMQSIQVSKGASSVKNGYESITGQINVEMKKPQNDPSLSVNMYYDILNKLEANIDGNWHMDSNWSAGLLTHYEDRFSTHDGNDDGFVDMPRVRQFAAMPRVAYLGSEYVFQAAGKVIDEKREGGQIGPHSSMLTHPYIINIDTRRAELFTKNAYMFDRDNDGNIALILSGSVHDQDASYGIRFADILQREAYGSLMFERKWADGLHALSTGLSGTYDNYDYHTFLNLYEKKPTDTSEREGVAGIYGQYTLSLDNKLTAMAGLRYDYSSRFGSLVTPRLHLRYTPITDFSLHASIGTGARTPHPIAEYSYMLASSRVIHIASKLQREKALNTGAGFTSTFRPWGKKLGLSAEYYYTKFRNQLLLNLKNPGVAILNTRNTGSYSHVFQTELTFDLLSDLSLSAAWRYTDVKVNYGQGLVQPPLSSRNKALFTLGYSPKMGLWQFDVTCAITGGGRMPNPVPDIYHCDQTLRWSPTFKGYTTLNAQITRNFRHYSLYVGGENLTGYRQPNPIINASDPWSYGFDATMIYGPLHGALIYTGFRYNITKYI